MMFHPIDMDNWPRAETYRHFLSQTPCVYSMTVNMDITRLLSVVRKRGVRLFPALLYGLSCMVNRHAEFRMALDEQGNPGYYDVTHPTYTVFHRETESFTNLWTEFGGRFEDFYQRYLDDMHQYGMCAGEDKPADGVSLFYVSCIPWVSFAGFHLSIQSGYDDLTPIFTMGKYEDVGAKKLLPLAIQVHHASCDAFHAARFVQELQQWLDAFA